MLTPDFFFLFKTVNENYLDGSIVTVPQMSQDKIPRQIVCNCSFELIRTKDGTEVRHHLRGFNGFVDLVSVHHFTGNLLQQYNAVSTVIATADAAGFFEPDF